MPETRTSPGAIAAVVLAVVMLLALVYEGCYYGNFSDTVVRLRPDGSMIARPVYRVDGWLVRRALSPAHEFDRWLRPHFWNGEAMMWIRYLPSEDD